MTDEMAREELDNAAEPVIRRFLLNMWNVNVARSRP